MRNLLMGTVAMLTVVAAAGSTLLAETADAGASSVLRHPIAAPVRELSDGELGELQGRWQQQQWGFESDGPCTTSGCRWITNSYWYIFDVQMNLKCKVQEPGFDHCETCTVSACCRKIYCDSDASCSAANCDDYSRLCSTPQIGVLLWDDPEGPPPHCELARYAEGRRSI